MELVRAFVVAVLAGALGCGRFGFESDRIDSGDARERIEFDEAVKTQIVTLACGSPYHAQLFCYVAAIEATKAGADTVDRAILRKGLERACEDTGMLNKDDHHRYLALATQVRAPGRATE